MKIEYKYSQTLFLKMFQRKRMINTILIITAIIVEVFFGLLRRNGMIQYNFFISDSVLIDFIVGVFVFSVISNSAFLWSEKVMAKNSSLIYDGNQFEYIFLKSKGYCNNSKVYRRYIIKNIDTIKYTKYSVIIGGRISCSDVAIGFYKNKDVNFVKIPKYFDSLNTIIDNMKLRGC